MEIKFVRDKSTGELLVYKDGNYDGKIITMGDEISVEGEGENGKQGEVDLQVRN